MARARRATWGEAKRVYTSVGLVLTGKGYKTSGADLRPSLDFSNRVLGSTRRRRSAYTTSNSVCCRLRLSVIWTETRWTEAVAVLAVEVWRGSAH